MKGKSQGLVKKGWSKVRGVQVSKKGRILGQLLAAHPEKEKSKVILRNERKPAIAIGYGTLRNLSQQRRRGKEASADLLFRWGGSTERNHVQKA